MDKTFRHSPRGLTVRVLSELGSSFYVCLRLGREPLFHVLGSHTGYSQSSSREAEAVYEDRKVRLVQWMSAIAVGGGAFLITIVLMTKILEGLISGSIFSGDEGPVILADGVIALSFVIGGRLGMAAFHQSWRTGTNLRFRLGTRALAFGIGVYCLLVGLFHSWFIGIGVGQPTTTLNAALQLLLLGAVLLLSFALAFLCTEWGRLHRRIANAAPVGRTFGERNEIKLRGWGEPEQQRRLAEAYQLGELGLPDEREAEYWFRRAANDGDLKAKIALAKLLAYGTGGIRDPVEALAWLSAASVSSDPMADGLRKKIKEQLSPEQIEEAAKLATFCGALSKRIRREFQYFREYVSKAAPKK
jgi:hypothetical protein